MALQQKIESKLEKSLGTQFNIQLQQQRGAFQASMLEAMKSLRDEMQSMKKSGKEVELDQSSTSASKPGPSKQSDNLPPNSAPNTHSEHTDEAMELDVYGPSLPPRFGDAQSEHGSDPNHGSDHQSHISKQPKQVCSARAKTFGQMQTQGSGQISFSVVILRGRSILCSQEKVYSAP